MRIRRATACDSAITSMPKKLNEDLQVVNYIQLMGQNL